MSKIDRKLWISDVVTPQSCPRKWGKWTKRICEETRFLFWFFLKLGRRAHHDRFFPTFGIFLAQTSLRQQLFKVSNIRNGIHCTTWLTGRSLVHLVPEGQRSTERVWSITGGMAQYHMALRGFWLVLVIETNTWHVVNSKLGMNHCTAETMRTVFCLAPPRHSIAWNTPPCSRFFRQVATTMLLWNVLVVPLRAVH